MLDDGKKGAARFLQTARAVTSGSEIIGNGLARGFSRIVSRSRQLETGRSTRSCFCAQTRIASEATGPERLAFIITDDARVTPSAFEVELPATKETCPLLELDWRMIDGDESNRQLSDATKTCASFDKAIHARFGYYPPAFTVRLDCNYLGLFQFWHGTSGPVRRGIHTFHQTQLRKMDVFHLRMRGDLALDFAPDPKIDLSYMEFDLFELKHVIVQRDDTDTAWTKTLSDQSKPFFVFLRQLWSQHNLANLDLYDHVPHQGQELDRAGISRVSLGCSQALWSLAGVRVPTRTLKMHIRLSDGPHAHRDNYHYFFNLFSGHLDGLFTVPFGLNRAHREPSTGALFFNYNHHHAIQIELYALSGLHGTADLLSALDQAIIAALGRPRDQPSSSLFDSTKTRHAALSNIHFVFNDHTSSVPNSAIDAWGLHDFVARLGCLGATHKFETRRFAAPASR